MCGELNGAWTPSTRRAMKAFTDRVNATLPVEEPDGILFAMVQGHQDRACGKPCPSSQSLSEDGRCLPNAILRDETTQVTIIATTLVKSKVVQLYMFAPYASGKSIAQLLAKQRTNVSQLQRTNRN
jgi:hypothetical protein